MWRFVSRGQTRATVLATLSQHLRFSTSTQRLQGGVIGTEVSLSEKTASGKSESEKEHFLDPLNRAARGDRSDEVDEEFDELEAASQEVHDLCFALIAYLRRADPDADASLFYRRVKRRLREPTPEQNRRLLHGRGDRAARSRNSFATKEDFKAATALYVQWMEKLLALLDKPVVDRLLQSAGKGDRDLRQEGIYKNKNLLEKASWRTFPHRWYKHAPFEVQQLRADIPEAAVLNTRFYRDRATLRYLFTLMEPNHPYRGKIEKKMFELTQAYDPSYREKL